MSTLTSRASRSVSMMIGTFMVRETKVAVLLEEGESRMPKGVVSGKEVRKSAFLDALDLPSALTAFTSKT